MSVSNYQHTLKNPFYCGLMFFNGELYEGKHEPIISKSLFDEAQAVMERKSKPKTRTLKPYVYRGSSHAASAAVSSRQRPKRATITCAAPSGFQLARKDTCGKETVKEQVDCKITKVALQAAPAAWMVSELEKTREEAATAQAEAIERTKADLAHVEKKIDILLDMRLSEQIAEQEYVSKKHILLNRKAELKGTLGRVNTN